MVGVNSFTALKGVYLEVMIASFFGPTKKESMDVDSEVDCFVEVCMRLWTTRKLVLNLNGWMSD